VHPADCPRNWEYDSDPSAISVLTPRCDEFLVSLKTFPGQHQPLITDSRPAHELMFEGLTPPACEYFAGNYRGEPLKCIEHYNVRIKSDADVGTIAHDVQEEMNKLAAKVNTSVASLDAYTARQGANLKAADLLSFVVPLSAILLEKLLTIHPYANGNGHMGRLVIWVLLARYGIFPQSWPLEARPPYDIALWQHRRGEVVSLQYVILKCIIS
jgi:hypothetical protein